MRFELPADSLTPAMAAEANLTVGEVIEAKLNEMAGLCKTAAATSPLEQEYVDWLMQEVARPFPAAILAGLMALCPRVDVGETGEAYGDRLLGVVSGG